MKKTTLFDETSYWCSLNMAESLVQQCFEKLILFSSTLSFWYTRLKKRCRLKSINHEGWDLMDWWVELYKHCKFKVLFRNVYIIEAFRDDAFQ